MKVIFFTYAYPPLKYPRSIQIARLVKYSSHEILVVCCDDKSPKDYTIASDIVDKPAGILVVKKQTFHLFGLRLLIDYMLLPDQNRSWALDTADQLLKTGQFTSYKVLVTFGQPMSVHLAGLKIKRATGLPWIAHFSDPWVDSPYRQGFSINLWLNRKMERDVIANADRIIFSSQETVDLVMAKYPPAWKAKAVVVPHAFDSSLYGNSYFHQDGFVFRCIGNFYGKRTPEPLIHAVAKLYHDQPEIFKGVKVELIGRMRRHVNLPDELPQGLLSIYPSVDYRTSLNLMLSADVLLVIDAPLERSVFLPSKLIDYIGAARPILAISPPGVTAELVSRLGGFVANPKNIPEIAEKLSLAITSLRTVRPNSWGREDVRAEFEASSVASRMDSLISELIA